MKCNPKLNQIAILDILNRLLLENMLKIKWYLASGAVMSGEVLFLL
tara:strand:+ start:539 stop:676 length:138 start_codon:yes stop_codon:yes gene_type:complete